MFVVVYLVVVAAAACGVGELIDRASDAYGKCKDNLPKTGPMAADKRFAAFLFLPGCFVMLVFC